jgi:YidC/Oxa1 family membrane protein insertase
MDRKGLLIIIATIGIFAGWQVFYNGPTRQKEVADYLVKKAAYDADQDRLKAEAAKQAAANPPPVAVPGAPTPAVPATPGTPAVPFIEPVVVKAITDDTKTVSSEVGTVQYVFTPHGAGIARVVLTDHFDDKAKQTKIILNEFGTFPIGAFSEQPDDPAEVNLTWEKFDVDEKAHTVTFVREDKLRSLRITKKFSLPIKPDENDKRRVKLRSEYLVGMDVTYENLSAEPRVAPLGFLHLGGAAPINQHEASQYQAFDYWRDGSNNSKPVDSFSAGGMLFWSHPERPIIQDDRNLIRWGAVSSQYFTTLVTVLGGEGKSSDEQAPILGIASWAKRTTISADDWRKPVEPWRPNGHDLSKTRALYQLDGAIKLNGVTVSAGQTVTRSFQIYAGPREYRRLRLLDHDEADVLDYGNFLGIIPTGPFSRLLLNTMNFLYAYVTFNYALAIILLTICVKAILWPLQNKANRNMKKMAELQPQMKELQTKFKDDPQRFQQEMGKMWKKAGVNPLGGCWPIFIQVPIFIGFYNMLGKAVELRHHSFLWVKDLAAPDTVLLLAGYPINPLPLLMAGTMFLQMKMAPQGGDPAQRKIFMFMPLIFVFFCYSFASALALYWTVQNIISIVQLLMNRNKTAAAAKVSLQK